MFDELGKIGVWRSAAQLSPELAVTLERLGYGAIWIGGSPSGDLRLAEQLLDATTTLTVATGIVNIWKDEAEPVAASYHRIEARHPGRFLLGIGVGHPEAIGARYAKPYEALVGYLDELDAAQVPIGHRVLAALGPKMLKLSAERAAGAHPYLTTPEHTRNARAIASTSPASRPPRKQRVTCIDSASIRRAPATPPSCRAPQPASSVRTAAGRSRATNSRARGDFSRSFAIAFTLRGRSARCFQGLRRMRHDIDSKPR